MYSTEEVLAAARAIRTHLPRLIGPDSTLGDELDRLLDDAAAGKPVEGAVIALLTRYESTRVWTDFFLNGDERAAVGTVRGFAPLPGEMPAPVPARLYACPEPGCTTVWRCRAAGQPIPRCPAHVRLVEPLVTPA
jgi:hypothetical protein